MSIIRRLNNESLVLLTLTRKNRKCYLKTRDGSRRVVTVNFSLLAFGIDESHTSVKRMSEHGILESLPVVSSLQKSPSAMEKVLQTLELLSCILKEAEILSCPSRCQLFIHDVAFDRFGLHYSPFCSAYHRRSLHTYTQVSRKWSSVALKRLYSTHTNPRMLRCIFSDPSVPKVSDHSF